MIAVGWIQLCTRYAFLSDHVLRRFCMSHGDVMVEILNGVCCVLASHRCIYFSTSLQQYAREHQHSAFTTSEEIPSLIICTNYVERCRTMNKHKMFG